MKLHYDFIRVNAVSNAQVRGETYNTGCIGQTGIIEGFGGKRVLGFLLKIELCRKRSKFRMHFCLGALNNVLYVFLLKFASFTRYYVFKKACICGLIST